MWKQADHNGVSASVNLSWRDALCVNARARSSDGNNQRPWSPGRSACHPDRNMCFVIEKPPCLCSSGAHDNKSPELYISRRVGARTQLREPDYLDETLRCPLCPLRLELLLTLVNKKHAGGKDGGEINVPKHPEICTTIWISNCMKMAKNSTLSRIRTSFHPSTCLLKI